MTFKVAAGLFTAPVTGFLLCFLFQNGCASCASVEAPPQLSDGWAVAAPEDAGFDAGALAKLTKRIRNNEFPNTHAVLIEHDGRLVYEQYFDGTDERWGAPLGRRTFTRDSLHDIRSVTKSVTATVVGIALGSSAKEALTNAIGPYFPNVKPGAEYKKVTLEHLLTMTAGLDWNEMELPYTNKENDEIRMSQSDDPFQFVLRRPLREEPGSRWYYNGGLSQLLAGVVTHFTGQSLDRYARTVLFEPLGIDQFEWIEGTTWKCPSPYAASGLRLKARDLAKIGSLYLHNGRWSGRQVVPEIWVRLSRQRHVKEIDKRWSAGGTWGYGYHWWHGRFPQGYTVTAAFGNGNQRVFILPEQRLVVTVLAGEYNKFEGHSERLLHAIMAAR